jgi:hypothetical protein
MPETLSARSKRHERELERYRRGFEEAGNVLSLIMALRKCARYKTEAPPWVLRSAASLLGQSIRRGWRRKPGRVSSLYASLRRDYIDYLRWQNVKRARSVQRDLRQTHQSIMARRRTPESRLREIHKFLLTAKHAPEGVIEQAYRSLRDARKVPESAAKNAYELALMARELPEHVITVSYDDMLKWKSTAEHDLRRIEEMFSEFGKTWLDVYEYVSTHLAGTPCAGSAETIKASYQRVARNLRDPRKSLRYQEPDFQTKRDLGFTYLDQPVQG